MVDKNGERSRAFIRMDRMTKRDEKDLFRQDPPQHPSDRMDNLVV